MQTLAIETTQRTGSLALLESDTVIDERDLDSGLRSAASIAVCLRDLLAENELAPTELDLIAVASGPGSFTGLRVGVTVAKTLAYATGAQALAVNTLAAIAINSPDANTPLWTILDAQRQQLFAAKFVRRGNQLDVIVETHISEIDHWLDQLSPDDVVAGPALEKLAAQLPDGVQTLDSRFWHPRASCVGQLAVAKFNSGRRDDLWKLTPQYFRKSAAEEKAEASGEGTG
jgi:tRNA threonylcarbamoyladenosine biosynthesis protein TsaB